MSLSDGFSDFQLLVQSTIDAIVVADESGIILYVNPAVQALLGYTPEELIGKNLTVLMPERYQPLHQKGMGRYLKTGTAKLIGSRVPVEATCKNGREVPIEIALSVHHGPKGRFFVAIMRDASERRTAEAELQQREEEARRAYVELLSIQEEVVRNEQTRALGEMAAGVAHQFNNVLMMISGLVELALTYSNDHNRVREYLEKMKISTSDGTNIVRRLQAFIRRTPSQQPEAISVNDIIKASVQITQPKWKDEVEKKGITVNLHTDLKPVPPVEGLASELREVMVNLILNAVDAMPNGGALTVSSFPRDGKVIISVQDTGTGMSAETLSKLFIPFFSTKTERGTGLGLFICRNIITHMHGTISVKSKEGWGTAFTLELPPVTSSSVPRKETTKKISVPAVQARVLVVDDEPSICEILQGFLEIDDHRVATFTDPVKALEAFSREPFDLVVTDLGMAPLNGWDVLREIKRVNPRTKTILLTGWGMNVESDEGAAKGADVVLSKPIEMRRLNIIVQQILTSS